RYGPAGENTRARPDLRHDYRHVVESPGAIMRQLKQQTLISVRVMSIMQRTRAVCSAAIVQSFWSDWKLKPL
ncbi:MAG: hypothetical protein WBN90_13425, partial [Gammaproteobacteria bacterium]